MIKSTLAPLALIALAASGCSSPAKVSLGHGELTGADGSAGRDGGTKKSSVRKSPNAPLEAGVVSSKPVQPAAPPATAHPTATPPDTTVVPDAAVGAASNCSAIVTSGSVANADVYVMLDQSSSLGDAYPITADGTWWTAVQQAFNFVVGDPAFAGLVMGLQYFPLGGVAPDSCSGHYETPDVELAPLPGNAHALKTSLASHAPVGFTPTAPALTGAISHMKAWASAHPGRRPFVLFVTDGFPTECDPEDLDEIAALVRRGRDTEPPVRVGVVALNLGAGAGNLDAIAKAGGTDFAHAIDGGDANAQLKEAIQYIVTSPVSCD